MRRRFWSIALIAMLFALPALAQEADEAEETEESPWKGSLGLAYLATSGNTDTSTFGLDFTLNREAQPWGFEALAQFNRAEDSGVVTAERYLLSARALRALNERWDFFAGLSAEKDEFAGFELRGMVETGVVYKALMGPKHHLAFDVGLTWTDEDRVEPEPDADYLGGLAGLAYEWKISDSASFTQRFLFYPNFDNSDDWRLNSDTGIQAAINDWLALKFGYELRYRNEPIGDADDTDTTTKFSVVLNF
jgi:putative salt-induced outer membrane protein